MERWYTTCPYLLVSSRYEGGHSLALLEALSYGCLAFVSPIVSNTEIIRDTVNGFLISGTFCASDAEKILQNLAIDKQRAVRLHAAETAAQNEWRDQITRLETILCSQS
jgi:glycosyltransferase involved in cell wall biosynthesis